MVDSNRAKLDRLSMADLTIARNRGNTKIRNVPIAVTPEGFWCCPSPAALQKTLKNHNLQSKHSPSKASSQKKTNTSAENRTPSNSLKSKIASDDQNNLASDTSAERPPKSQQRKISVGFGSLETSDLKLIVSGTEGVAVKMSVHKSVLSEFSSFFADKLSKESPVSCLEIGYCDDVEIYVETVGLMYCKQVRKRLMKQTVPRVLRILKIAELIGYKTCINSCLEYLEAVPWAGEEEEENVVTSLRNLQCNSGGVRPILKRVSSELTNAPEDTLSHILELVLKSNDVRARREMKTLVLKLLRENRLVSNGPIDICKETLYISCQSCLDSLLGLFRQASEPGFLDKPFEIRDPISKQISIEVDNLLWLVDILADRQLADEFIEIWTKQTELADIHSKLSTMSRHLISCITSRLFVGIGRGEMLPSKEIRHRLLQTWLHRLVDDYSWLQQGCRNFDSKAVEEGIGRTILTLPLDDQQSILLSWLGRFLKVGDNCPNLQRAFEVWWRRTFIRPYVDPQGKSSAVL